MFRYFVLCLAIHFTACGIADLRTADIKKETQAADSENKARQLLDQAIKTQGFDQISRYSTYEVIGVDHWKGLLGKMGNVWNWKKDKMAMRFTVGDFDGQVEVLEGKKKGFVAGIQSWDYYEIEEGRYNTEVKDDKRISFALAAYHYYYELALRLQRAPFIRYYGTDKIDGIEMDKILVSWGNKRTKDYDQYVLWINPESGLIEAVTHTVRDNYMPMTGFLYSSARFTDFRDVEGVMIPFKQTIQLKQPRDNENKYIHQFIIESFRWDAFPAERLRPNPNLSPVGDDKIAG